MLPEQVNVARAVLIGTGQLADTDWSQSWHASHLCHHKWCVNSAHTVAGSPADNILRNACVSPTRPCPHDPPFLLPPNVPEDDAELVGKALEYQSNLENPVFRTTAHSDFEMAGVTDVFTHVFDFHGIEPLRMAAAGLVCRNCNGAGLSSGQFEKHEVEFNPNWLMPVLPGSQLQLEDTEPTSQPVTQATRSCSIKTRLTCSEEIEDQILISSLVAL